MKVKITFCLLLLFFSSAAIAQENLSLSEAITTGLANNFDIQIEKKNIEVATNNNNIGEAGFLPTLSLTLNQNNNITNNESPNPFAIQGDIITRSINPIVSVNWTIFDGFRARITRDRLRNLQGETEGNAAIVVQNTLQSIVQGYYKAVLEKERLHVFETSLNLSREKYAYVQLKKDLGSAVTADLLLEEGNYLTDSTNYVNQVLAYRGALRTLNNLLGIDDVNTEYNFTDKLSFKDKSYTIEDLFQKMSSNNANLKKQYLSQKILQNATDLARASLYPTVSVGLNYSNNINSSDFSRTTLDGAPQIPILGSTVNTSANFTITYNLFNGGRIKRAIQNAVIQEEIGKVRIDKLKLELHRDLEAALDLYNIRMQLRGIAIRNKKAADLNLQVSQERFKNGTINSFDYRTIQNRFLTSSLNELQAIYNLIDANVQLMRLTGGIVEEY
ncbi:MAG: TolC family protein [Flammeovirgaceae bacterium]